MNSNLNLSGHNCDRQESPVVRTAREGSSPMAAAPGRAVKRDSFIDGWRGIFHVVLTIDHLSFIFPGTFTLIANFYEALGFVTVAEGFVFLSGFVSGLVYTRLGREKGYRAMQRKAFVRSRDIYFCYVLAVVALLTIVKYGGRSSLAWGGWEGLFNFTLPVAIAKVVSLLYQPTFLEILPLYCGLLLVTPVILKQLESGRHLAVMAVSLAVWTAAQFDIRGQLLRLLPTHVDVYFGYFNFFGWQILFVGGVICGHKTFHFHDGWLPRGRLLPALAGIAALLCFAVHHGYGNITIDERLVDRSAMGLVRLVNFFSLVFLVSKARKWLEKYVAWNGFAFLSRYSLQVFAFHMFPMYAAAIAFGSSMSLPAHLQLLFIFICIGSLFQIAFLTKSAKLLWSRLGADIWRKGSSSASS